ncbi:tetratricopeptide repeat protein [Paenibacillus sp. Marseille-Q4541]|uniref:tetratricopeptide repeat protein n=1 Tax=Paenibacillus sp. Marseille-Q4541 TaxID=2831522 RepID=UPI001BAA464D|nr:tetratricopeptide repeat protein [Paenibacillus sp. Marseille-Q4541]
MKGKPQRTDRSLVNVVPIQLDASFFFERAVRSLDRNHYDKALKYFSKAAEYEPENPVNHCNVAGILSEMGDYARSNEILNHVLTEVDPSMMECYFYMANNYANMEQFEDAEEAIVTYLEEDEQGQFLDEAEELLDLLFFELGRKAPVKRIKAREGIAEHDYARSLLEEGKFAQAAEMLEKITKDQPDFTAARNNLALAYYYMGRFSKAKDTIFDLLTFEPGNLHGLCNLAIFFQNEGNKEQVAALIKQLQTLVPFEQEHVFKLGTTMGILGEHESAYAHFRRLLKNKDTASDPSLVHYAAVAACNTKRFKEAARLWEMVKMLDPDSEVPKFYISQLESREEEQEVGTISYHYHLPFEEQFRLWEKYGASIPEDIKNDPLIRSSFFWALHHGDDTSKAQVIIALRHIGDYEVYQALTDFLEQPDENTELKELALSVLREIGTPETLSEGENPYKASGPTDATGTPEQDMPELDDRQQAVLNKVLEKMDKYSDILREGVQYLWADYLKQVSPELPSISLVEGWSAALEYLTVKSAGEEVTYKEVAGHYGVSASTVSRYAKQIDLVCNSTHLLKPVFRALSEKM